MAVCPCRCPSRRSTSTATRWTLAFRRMLPVEEWNAQISLLTGMAAASLMVYARVGLLRTLPPPDPRDVQRLHRTAKALRIDWPAEQLYPDFIRSLDPDKPNHAAMVVACTRLLRGSGYVAFNGEIPEQPEHSALASEYAHVTAPLRRLGDRYAGEVCLALCAGTEVPSWVLEKLEVLPKTLQESGRKAHQYEGSVLDLVEAAVLRPHLGETFPGVVVQVDEDDPKQGDVVVQEPAIEGRVTSSRELPLGTDVEVRLVEADIDGRQGALRAPRARVGRACRDRHLGPLDCSWMSRPGDRGEETRRGRSGLHRARWWVTPTRGDPRESATEKRPPPCSHGGKGETVV